MCVRVKWNPAKCPLGSHLNVLSFSIPYCRCRPPPIRADSGPVVPLWITDTWETRTLINVPAARVHGTFQLALCTTLFWAPNVGRHLAPVLAPKGQSRYAIEARGGEGGGETHKIKRQGREKRKKREGKEKKKGKSVPGIHIPYITATRLLYSSILQDLVTAVPSPPWTSPGASASAHADIHGTEVLLLPLLSSASGTTRLSVI